MPRKHAGKRTAKRVRKDWVYRTHSTSEDDLSVGTYSNQFYLTNAGRASAFMGVLYDSHDFIAAGIDNPTSGFSSDIGAWARSEGARPRIYGCDLDILVLPYNWSYGNTVGLGLRMGAFEQADTGLVSIDPAYSMYDLVSAWEEPGRWADRKNWVWEYRRLHNFGDGSNAGYKPWWIHHRWRSRRGFALRPEEMWGLWVENEAGTTRCTMQFWCRTLVGAEDS